MSLCRSRLVRLVARASKWWGARQVLCLGFVWKCSKTGVSPVELLNFVELLRDFGAFSSSWGLLFGHWTYACCSSTVTCSSSHISPRKVYFGTFIPEDLPTLATIVFCAMRSWVISVCCSLLVQSAILNQSVMCVEMKRTSAVAFGSFGVDLFLQVSSISMLLCSLDAVIHLALCMQLDVGSPRKASCAMCTADEAVVFSCAIVGHSGV